MINLKYIQYIAAGLLFVILQIIIFRHLTFFGVQPDIVIIFIVWIAINTERTTAIIIVTITAFFQDALLDVWGLNMFAKTLSLFMAYNPLSRLKQSNLLVPQVFLTSLLFSLLHYIIFLTVGGLLEAYSSELNFWKIWFGNSIYTALMGIFIYLLYTDRKKA